MDYTALEDQLKELRSTVITDPKLSKEEREDLKLAIVVLLILVNHRIADGG